MKRFVAKVDLVANGVVGQDNPRKNDCILTEINGPIEKIKEYYAIGKTFNMGMWGGYMWVYDNYFHRSVQKYKEHEDNLMHVTNLFVLEDCEKTTKFCDWLGEKYGWDWKEHFDEKEYAEFCS